MVQLRDYLQIHQSAKDALHEVKAVFDVDQPFIKIMMKKTRKDQSVYYVEVL